MNLIRGRYGLDDFFDDFFTSTPVSHMKCDIYEKDNYYNIEMDVAGFDKNDIAIDIKDGYLNITSEKKSEKDEKDKNYIRRERSYGKYSRSFYVGDVNEEEIKAKVENGILKISLPKKEQVETKKTIEIED